MIKKIIAFILCLLCSTFFVGCNLKIAFVPGTLLEDEYVPITLIDGETKTKEYFHYPYPHLDEEKIPKKQDKQFLGYFDSPTSDKCYISYNGKFHSTNLTNFPKTLYAQYTTNGNQTITYDDPKEINDATKNVYFYTRDLIVPNNCSTLNLYYYLYIKETTSDWSDCSFKFISGYSFIPVCNTITLTESNFISSNYRYSYFGKVTIHKDQIVDGVVGYELIGSASDYSFLVVEFVK